MHHKWLKRQKTFFFQKKIDFLDFAILKIPSKIQNEFPNQKEVAVKLGAFHKSNLCPKNHVYYVNSL